jgi:putative oxidoreductase
MTSRSMDSAQRSYAGRIRGEAVRAFTATLPSALDRSLERVARFAPAAVRLSLGLVFVWFGALKVAGDSPVTALVSATIPWGRTPLVIPLLGVVEILLGLGLLIGKAKRLLLLAVAVHLGGTLLTFVMAPNMTMRHGNPFLLTADGEFVLKNLVLITAAILLVSLPARSSAAAAGTVVEPSQLP